MKKFIIPIVFYRLLSFLFFTLCLSGLVIQDLQISFNYFKYEIVSDIKLIQPEDIKRVKDVNLCFFSWELFNRTKFEHIFETEYPNEKFKDDRSINQWTIEQRLSIAIDQKRLFSHYGRNLDKNPIIFVSTPWFICYQIDGNSFDDILKISVDEIRNIRVFLVSLSDPLPYVDSHRFNIRSSIFVAPNITTIITLDSHNFFIEKLESPYLDACYDYKINGYVDRLNAIHEYFHHITNGSLMTGQNIQEDNEKFLNSKAFLLQHIQLDSICEKKYPKSDCYRNITFTRSSIQKMEDGRDVRVVVIPSQDPSFRISSKPKIDLIDFVTFIFGTIGTWLGLSFASINPLLIFFTTPNQSKLKQSTSSTDIKRLEQEILRIKIWSKLSNNNFKRIYSILRNMTAKD